LLTEHQKAWFKQNKGINEETLEAFGVHSDDDYEWVVFPHPRGEKKRYIGPGQRKFTSPSGARLGLFGKADPNANYCFLVEGETDTMRLWQEGQGIGLTNVYGMSGLYGLYEEDLPALDSFETIYVVLDNDDGDPYKGTGNVDTAWNKIRKALGLKARRIVLPENVKDIVEFFDSYSIETFTSLVKECKKGTTHYTPLDLTIAPPEYEWLVDGLIARGDSTLLVGEPNVGKSWISLSLAVAVANGDDKWIKWNLNHQGRVLYIDEENPYDVVYHRLKQLGLEKHDNLRYLHRQGVRLDKRFDKFLDEAIAYNPSLIVMDSLTRLHTQDENNAGAMAALFNDSINVLTKETGSAILILHHTNKGESTSSYVRTRGSSDIGAAVDCGLEARAEAPGRFRLIHFKSRRKQAGDVSRIEITDKPDQRVNLEIFTEVEPY
jgi:KaiC/GvpD/RAD55 family RecA-like ATPase